MKQCYPQQCQDQHHPGVGLKAVAPAQREQVRSTEGSSRKLAAYFKQFPNNLSIWEALISEKGQVDDASSQSLPQSPAWLCSFYLPSWVNFQHRIPPDQFSAYSTGMLYTMRRNPSVHSSQIFLLPQGLASNSFSGTQMAVAGTPIPTTHCLLSSWSGLTGHISCPQ